MFFQMTFAIITPALIAGALADRMKFSAFLWFMGLWLLLVYCPIAHWAWGGCFLGAGFGALGAMLTGVFASNAINPAGKGWLHDGNAAQLWAQFLDVAFVFVYCAIATFIILKAIDMVIGLRVSREVEVEGLDINLHGEIIHG
jgi:ammonia channel protein AmtB